MEARWTRCTCSLDVISLQHWTCEDRVHVGKIPAGRVVVVTKAIGSETKVMGSLVVVCISWLVTLLFEVDVVSWDTGLRISFIGSLMKSVGFSGSFTRCYHPRHQLSYLQR